LFGAAYCGAAETEKISGQVGQSGRDRIEAAAILLIVTAYGV
jgi:hypothetical protein